MLKFYTGDKVRTISGNVKGLNGWVTQIWVVEDPSPINENVYDVVDRDGTPWSFKESELELLQPSDDRPIDETVDHIGSPKQFFEDIVLERVDPRIFDGDDEPVDMAVVKGGFAGIRLAVRSSEGKYPHFHFYKGYAPNQSVKDGRHGGGCILLTLANYFIHGSHTEMMNRKEIKALHEFLREKNRFGVTNWQHLIELWNESNEDQPQVPIDAEIPVYFSSMPSITG